MRSSILWESSILYKHFGFFFKSETHGYISKLLSCLIQKWCTYYSPVTCPRYRLLLGYEVFCSHSIVGLKDKPVI